MNADVVHMINSDFEKLYLRLREKENRVYSDTALRLLPDINEWHPHFAEWQLRKQSSQRLINYLEKKQQPLKILEVGCGNGWLSHRLATITDSQVIGIDINFTEIQQAANVFGEMSNLHFIYGAADESLLGERQFDVIIFAASIQYFSPLDAVVDKTLKLLRSGGEIHILDSPFYTLAELSSARQRSALYYQAAGFPEMTQYYFHHSLDDLDRYNYTLLYDPLSLFNKFLRTKNPFPWIRIQ